MKGAQVFKMSIRSKGLIAAMMVWACAVPGVGLAQTEAGVNNCWFGALVFPPNKEYRALQAYQKAYSARLKSHPEDSKIAARLRAIEQNLAKILDRRTPAQRLFATGGAVPIVITDKSPFFTGETLRLRFRTCAAQPIEGFCSQEAANALAGQIAEAPILGIAALAKDDGLYGHLNLYVEPELDGMRGRAFARVEFAGPPHWEPAHANTDLAATCFD